MVTQAVRGSGPAQRERRRRGAPATAAPIPATKSIHQSLLQHGMTSTEAASLTALMCGLPSTDLRWSIQQLNHLLFLRRMHETGRY
jgi:hypothetical protein